MAAAEDETIPSRRPNIKNDPIVIAFDIFNRSFLNRLTPLIPYWYNPLQTNQILIFIEFIRRSVRLSNSFLGTAYKTIPIEIRNWVVNSAAGNRLPAFVRFYSRIFIDWKYTAYNFARTKLLTVRRRGHSIIRCRRLLTEELNGPIKMAISGTSTAWVQKVGIGPILFTFQK